MLDGIKWEALLLNMRLTSCPSSLASTPSASQSGRTREPAAPSTVSVRVGGVQTAGRHKLSLSDETRAVGRPRGDWLSLSPRRRCLVEIPTVVTVAVVVVVVVVVIAVVVVAVVVVTVVVITVVVIAVGAVGSALTVTAAAAAPPGCASASTLCNVILLSTLCNVSSSSTLCNVSSSGIAAIVPASLSSPTGSSTATPAAASTRAGLDVLS